MRPTSPSSQTNLVASKKKHGASADGWANAVELCEKLTSRADQKADALLNHLTKDISPQERRRCQRLFYGAVRHWRLIDHLIDSLVEKPPRPRLRAMLMISLGEWLENLSAGADLPQTSKKRNEDEGRPPVDFFPGLEKDESLPKIVDFTVNRVKGELSKGEGKFTNAVLRRAAALTAEINESGSLGLRTSHPDWLVRRWINERGSEWTERTLLQNQKSAEPALRWRTTHPPPESWLPIDTVPLSNCVEFHDTERERLPAPPSFFHLPNSQAWELASEKLKNGEAYAQDPATWLALALAGAQPGNAVLDLCAAPGGKASYLLEALGQDPSGLLVLLDKPGLRIEQLDENLRAWTGDNEDGPEVALIAMDLLEAEANALGSFAAVILDAPCSNTGVIRRRPDVKFRLTLDGINECAELQLKMLTKAAEFVAEGGGLIYSTCSLEPEENAGVVERFLEANPEWIVTASAESSPAATGFDGATVFRLERG